MGNAMSGGDAWKSWEEINRICSGKRIVFFGRGEWLEKALNYIAKEADYVVDNNKYEHGQTEQGLKIYSPDRLRTEDWDQIFVIITTSGFQEVDEQLREFGLTVGRHYCVSPSLKNYHAVSRLNRHDQTVYLTCSDRYMKDETQRGGGLYSYNLQTREIRKIINGQCHGMVEADDAFYLVDDIVGVRVLNKDFSTREIFDLPAKSRPHGIGYSTEKRQVFVNLSGRDSIAVVDAGSHRIVSEKFLSGKWNKTGVAQHHINDVCAYGNSLFVTMFSQTGNWKLGVFDGCVLELDIDSMDITGVPVRDLWLPHTPVIIKGMLYYCDSMRGIVRNTNWKILSEFNGFVRGISYDGRFYYIGQSMHRYVDRRYGTTNNISLDTGFFVLDEEFKVTRFFSTPQLTDINTVFIPSSNLC